MSTVKVPPEFQDFAAPANDALRLVMTEIFEKRQELIEEFCRAYLACVLPDGLTLEETKHFIAEELELVETCGHCNYTWSFRKRVKR